MINLMVKPTEVSAKGTRRRFTAADKIRILRVLTASVSRRDLTVDRSPALTS